VLVVEDAQALADIVAEGLRDDGMAVDVAYDALQAATKLDLNLYDLVILDRDLPGLHGDTLCRMITEGDDPAMVLMLTASGSPAQRVSGLSLGADDYLPKPFHFPELMLRIRALTRRQLPGAPRPRHRTRTGTPHHHPRRTPPRPLQQGVRGSTARLLHGQDAVRRSGDGRRTGWPSRSKSPLGLTAAHSAIAMFRTRRRLD
jgi:DNA-binding response OmpR family regulator